MNRHSRYGTDGNPGGPLRQPLGIGGQTLGAKPSNITNPAVAGCSWSTCPSPVTPTPHWDPPQTRSGRGARRIPSMPPIGKSASERQARAFPPTTACGMTAPPPIGPCGKSFHGRPPTRPPEGWHRPMTPDPRNVLPARRGPGGRGGDTLPPPFSAFALNSMILREPGETGGPYMTSVFKHPALCRSVGACSGDDPIPPTTTSVRSSGLPASEEPCLYGPPHATPPEDVSRAGLPPCRTSRLPARNQWCGEDDEEEDGQ